MRCIAGRTTSRCLRQSVVAVGCPSWRTTSPLWTDSGIHSASAAGYVLLASFSFFLGGGGEEREVGLFQIYETHTDKSGVAVSKQTDTKTGWGGGEVGGGGGRGTISKLRQTQRQVGGGGGGTFQRFVMSKNKAVQYGSCFLPDVQKGKPPDPIEM